MLSLSLSLSLSQIKRYVKVLSSVKYGKDLSIYDVYNYIKYKFLPKTTRLNNISYPLIMLMITRRCNLNCNFCIFGKDVHLKKYEEYEATPETLENFFSVPILKRALAVTLTGGEPLLNEQFIDIINYIKAQRKISTVITNGLLLPKYDISALKVVSDIQVSLYEHSCNKLSSILPAFANYLNINTSFVLTKTTLYSNPELIFEMANLSHASNCNSFRISFFMPFDGDTKDCLTSEDIGLYSQISLQLKKKFPKLNIVLPKLPHDSSVICKKCYQPWSIFLCDAKGDFTPCCGTKFSVDKPYGNIFTDSSEYTINSKFLVKLRENLLNTTSQPLKICKNCPHIWGTLTSNI